MEPENIYTVETFQSSGDEVTATVIFNENHPLFEGHFPGNPIVPGVVQVQIIKDLMEKKTGESLILIQAKNIKFLTIISPVKDLKVEVRIEFSLNEERLFPTQATIRAGDSIFMKFSGIYMSSTENK
jgi:3-hydroxyacyl-[acyl-carrier-protein] dehydratase